MSGVVTTEPLVGALPPTIVKYARGLTNASRYSQSGSTWGGSRNRPLPSASRLSAEVWGQVREGAADSQVRTERRWNTTSVSRETEGRVASPPRGVGVVLYGSPLPCRGQTDPRQEKAASWWNARPQGQADLSVSATNSGGKYTGELIPNPRERWFHVKPEEGRSGMAFVEVSSRRGACACSR